ncbi:EAL domain-containing protein [Chthonobacter rhizosphaerae]|uniref:EAL domain-containing protein n=1 Tax=Chthonobacter rhizosphaerae TaxID=2735553 RepID=UPI0015EEB286|nr:EAL domain-containing protein [Chthonobacter rhizosphaerae]
MLNCNACRTGLDFDFSMAFQPIVDVRTDTVFAYEALVRGMAGEGAGAVLSRVTDETRYAFDQKCRTKAVELAASLGMSENLSINFMPNAIYEPRLCLRSTFEASKRFAFPADRLIFELTEDERITDRAWIHRIIVEYRQSGLKVAIDDFGAGYAQLNLLAEIRPDIVKLDMEMVRGVDVDRGRQALVRGIVQACDVMDVRVVAEGIETEAEARTLKDIGIPYLQGYLFARPGFQSLPTPRFAVGVA